jgi:hypothetical protein
VLILIAISKGSGKPVIISTAYFGSARKSIGKRKLGLDVLDGSIIIEIPDGIKNR